MRAPNFNNKEHIFILTSRESVPQVFKSLATSFEEAKKRYADDDLDILIAEFMGPWDEEGELRLYKTWSMDNSGHWLVMKEKIT